VEAIKEAEQQRECAMSSAEIRILKRQLQVAISYVSKIQYKAPMYSESWITAVIGRERTFKLADNPN
jgi:hypothetical protein